MKKIILIGDSLTNLGFQKNGWCYYLVKSSNSDTTIINKSYCGWTSKMIYENIKNIINFNDISNISICTILLGTNDMNKNISSNYYKNYLLMIIYYLYSLNINTKILLITPPINSFCKNIKDYINVIFEISMLIPKIIIIDLHNEYNENRILYSDLYDGIHFNDNGNKKIYNIIKNYI
jgi:lysophospholipase L1-like esterase